MIEPLLQAFRIVYRALPDKQIEGRAMRCPLARGNAPTDVVMPSLSSVILNALCRQSHRPVDLMTDLCDSSAAW
jgi:hypothetical protein